MREQLEHMRLYRLGWIDGAGMIPKVQFSEDYARGWQDGRKALRSAMSEERSRLGLPVDSEILLQETSV